MRTFLAALSVSILLINSGASFGQDTTFVQTLTFDSTGRNYVFQFPEDTGQSYEKILMYYTMRCKDGLVSTGTDRNKGCGEWDYSCNTYITDSSYTDSVKATHPNYVISNFSGSIYNYSTQPTYDYYQYIQKSVSYSDTSSETEGTIGAGGNTLNHPFGISAQTSKTHYLILASELTAVGLSAGEFTGLKLNVNNTGGEVEYLRIKLKSTSNTIVDPGAPETGFTQVYFKNTTLSTDINEFKFYNNFYWDGTSNIVVEISYTNKNSASDIELIGHDAGFNTTLNSINDRYFDANGSTYLNMGAYPAILDSSKRTIELWSKVDLFNGAGIFQAGAPGSNGADFSLRNTGTIDSWRAQLWGAGFDFDFNLPGSYQSWHHYAMTYDGSVVSVYFDGTEISTNVANINTLAGNIYLAYWYGSKSQGGIDELRIWGEALPESTLNQWMYRKIDSNHPNYVNLIANFHLDGNLNDNSPATNTAGSVNGIELWGAFRGNEIMKDFSVSTFRPDLTLVQGVYTTVVTDISVTDTIEKSGDQIIAYSVLGTDLNIIDTSYGYSDPYEYLYNSSGVKLDSFAVSFDGSLTISSLDYMAKYPSKFEILSFVTPYGIGLDFGLGGKTWVFDVTDFTPILKGAKRMSMERGGQYQEQMDIRFAFISGTPPREVLDIRQLWRVESRNYTQIIDDDYFEPRDVQLEPTADKHKVRTVITGHGQQGEFIQRAHYINLDGGFRELVWTGWKECGENPIFPQGGTWVYDRAGWCPGAPSDVHELIFDHTSNTVNIDYGVTSGSGDSRYIVNSQLISYGPANFNLDAAITEIKRPSNMPEHGKINPACYDPIVVITNTGSSDLTSLTFNYSVSGGPTETFMWTGTLESLQSEDVILPISSGAFWVGDGTNQFKVTVSTPNGDQDGYEQNNTMISHFDLPDFYEGNMILETITNNLYQQNYYYIMNENGDTIRNRSFDSKAVFKDTLMLGEGCYYLEFHDLGDDGLDFWANTSQTTGYLVLKDMDDNALKVFENDFGGLLNYAFVVGEFVSVQEPNNKARINIYPNPAQKAAILQLDFLKQSNAEIRVVDMIGRTVYSTQKLNFTRGTIPLILRNIPSGIYNVVIQTGDMKETRKLVVE